MDAYILTRLDQLRETQLSHGERLDRIMLELAKSPPSSPSPTGFIPLLKSLISSGATGAVVIRIVLVAVMGHFVLTGGDPIKIIELLLKFSG